MTARAAMLVGCIAVVWAGVGYAAGRFAWHAQAGCFPVPAKAAPAVSKAPKIRA